jgi:hypothetical protein
MPRLCGPCRKHYADDALTACPACGGKVQFTLLGPPGEQPPPLAGVPTGPTGRLGYANVEALRDADDEPAPPPPEPLPDPGPAAPKRPPGLVVAYVVAGVLVVLVLAGYAFDHLMTGRHLPTPATADSTGRLRAGMPLTAVPAVLAPRPVGSVDRYLHDEVPRDPDATGDLVWQKQGRLLRITFSNGRVTGIAEGVHPYKDLERATFTTASGR